MAPWRSLLSPTAARALRPAGSQKLHNQSQQLQLQHGTTGAATTMPTYPAPLSFPPSRAISNYEPPFPTSTEKHPQGMPKARAEAYGRATPVQAPAARERKNDGEAVSKGEVATGSRKRAGDAALGAAELEGGGGQVPGTMMVENVKKFHRWSPDEGGRAKLQTFEMDVLQCSPMIPDVLGKIKSSVDSTLTYRRSHREGICGLCAMNIDGRNTLACLMPVHPDPTVAHTIMPLPHMFIVKDLVVDLTAQYQQYKSVEPWLKRKSPPPVDGREYRQSVEERQRLDGREQCILCFCCTAPCPSWWWNAEQFLGPAALIQASRWVMDSRDEYTAERLQQLSSARMYKCHTILNELPRAPSTSTRASPLRRCGA